MAKTKYKKYKTLYLPKEIVEAISLMHKFRISDFEKVRLDICFDIISNIIQKAKYSKVKNEDSNLFAVMASKYLQKRYGNKYTQHIKFLVNHNLVYRDDYFQGNASNLYIQDSTIYKKISESLIRDFIDLYSIETYSTYCLTNNIDIIPLDLINAEGKDYSKNRNYLNWYGLKIANNRSNKSCFQDDYETDSIFINNAPKHIKKMGSHFRKNFRLNTEAAIKHTLKKFQKESKEASSEKEERGAYNRSFSRISSIFSIDNGKNNKSLRFSRNSTNNRLDTNLTNMASDLKPYIVGWEEMVYLDLKNSQPVIFNTILKHHYTEGSSVLKSEIDDYRKATFAGKWYEELMTIFEADRDTCKEIWMCIAYSQNKSYQNYKKQFKKTYPEIYKIIESIKSTDYKNFAISLQKLESEIFIDKICKKLVDIDIIPFTVHDAIIVKQNEKERALQVMNNVFIEYLGDIPKISVE